MNINNCLNTLVKAMGILALCVLGLFTQSYAQVSIAPTSLFFDSQNRFTALTVSNGGNKAQEISIAVDFAFTTSKNGNIIISKDSTIAQEKSIAPWVKVFPKNFTLQPQQRQVVRFVLRAPANISTGGHWARVEVASNPVSPPIESVGENQIGTQINLVLKQVITAHYRTPGAETGIVVNAVDFKQNDNDNAGTISLSLEQNKNAPFVGSVSIQIKDDEGNTVYQTNATTSVFTTITRTFPIDTSNWVPGKYTITGNITSERRDISSENVLQIQPVSFNKQITIE